MNLIQKIKAAIRSLPAKAKGPITTATELREAREAAGKALVAKLEIERTKREIAQFKTAQLQKANSPQPLADRKARYAAEWDSIVSEYGPRMAAGDDLEATIGAQWNAAAERNDEGTLTSIRALIRCLPIPAEKRTANPPRGGAR